jgi:NAD-dependent SIR2 family protein deacetylase
MKQENEMATKSVEKRIAVQKEAAALIDHVRETEGVDRTMRERGSVRQECTSCGFKSDSSYIFREQAETYDPRCPRCGSSDGMRMTQWVPLTEETLSASRSVKEEP